MLTVEEKEKDAAIRLQISEELGHSRINITSVYLGSWSKKQMGIASEIREKLPLCGRCINCKLLIWNDKAELKNSQTLIKFKNLDSSYYYTVR